MYFKFTYIIYTLTSSKKYQIFITKLYKFIYIKIIYKVKINNTYYLLL